MKHIARIGLIAITLILGACSAGETVEPTPYDDTEAVKHGRADAQKVIDAPANGLERENALLNIRATEHKILTTGDKEGARAYMGAAKAMLDSAAIW